MMYYPPTDLDYSLFNMVYSKQIFNLPVEEETKALLDNVVSYFKEKQLPVIDEPLPRFKRISQLHAQMISIGGGQSLTAITWDNKSPAIIKEYLREVVFKSSDYHRYLTGALYSQKFFEPSKKKLNRLENEISEGAKEVNHFLERSVLVLPVYHRAALPHGKLMAEVQSFRTYLRYLPFLSYANVWGLPSLTVPVGLDQEGLPIAIQ